MRNMIEMAEAIRVIFEDTESKIEFLFREKYFFFHLSEVGGLELVQLTKLAEISIVPVCDDSSWDGVLQVRVSCGGDV